MMGLLLICIFTFATSVGTLVIVYRMMEYIKIQEVNFLRLVKGICQIIEDSLKKEKDGRSEQKI